MLCPSDTIDYYSNNCDFIIPNYIPQIILISDNCDSNPILTQDPAVGSLVNSDTVIKMTVTDGSGNFTSCFFNLTLIDTIKPVLTCPVNVSEYFNSSCEFVVTDLS